MKKLLSIALLAVYMVPAFGMQFSGRGKSKMAEVERMIQAAAQAPKATVAPAQVVAAQSNKMRAAKVLVCTGVPVALATAAYMYNPELVTAYASDAASYVQDGAVNAASYVADAASQVPAYASDAASYVQEGAANAASYVVGGASQASAYASDVASYVQEGAANAASYVVGGASQVSAYASDVASYVANSAAAQTVWNKLYGKYPVYSVNWITGAATRING